VNWDNLGYLWRNRMAFR